RSSSGRQWPQSSPAGRASWRARWRSTSMGASPHGESTPDDALRRLEERLDRASDAAERLMAEAARAAQARTEATQAAQARTEATQAAQARTEAGEARTQGGPAHNPPRAPGARRPAPGA